MGMEGVGRWGWGWRGGRGEGGRGRGRGGAYWHKSGILNRWLKIKMKACVSEKTNIPANKI